jgi:Leu/Phe-tRNA-protein transferase
VVVSPYDVMMLFPLPIDSSFHFLSVVVRVSNHVSSVVLTWSEAALLEIYRRLQFDSVVGSIDVHQGQMLFMRMMYICL